MFFPTFSRQPWGMHLASGQPGGIRNLEERSGVSQVTVQSKVTENWGFWRPLQRLKQAHFRPRIVLESDHQAFQPNWWVCPVTKTTSTTSPISWNLQGLPSLYGLRISVSQVMSSPCAKKEIECLTRNLVQLDKNWPVIFVWHEQIHKIVQPCLKKLWPHWGHCLPAALAGWHWEKASCEARSEDVGIPSRQQVWRVSLLGALVSPTCTLGTVFSQWFANMFWNA